MTRNDSRENAVFGLRKPLFCPLNYGDYNAPGVTDVNESARVGELRNQEKTWKRVLRANGAGGR